MDGFAGNNAGHIVIKCEGIIENLATIHCLASGANGTKGQKGGNGDEGRKGIGTPDAVAQDNIGFCNLTATHFAQARTPGLDAEGNIIRPNELIAQVEMQVWLVWVAKVDCLVRLLLKIKKTKLKN